MKQLSQTAQAMWDELGAATDEHYDDHPTARENTRAARRYINASRALHEYITDLEARARRK